jgi:hypothetical protein
MMLYNLGYNYVVENGIIRKKKSCGKTLKEALINYYKNYPIPKTRTLKSVALNEHIKSIQKLINILCDDNLNINNYFKTFDDGVNMFGECLKSTPYSIRMGNHLEIFYFRKIINISDIRISYDYDPFINLWFLFGETRDKIGNLKYIENKKFVFDSLTFQYKKIYNSDDINESYNSNIYFKILLKEIFSDTSYIIHQCKDKLITRKKFIDKIHVLILDNSIFYYTGIHYIKIESFEHAEQILPKCFSPITLILLIKKNGEVTEEEYNKYML